MPSALGRSPLSWLGVEPSSPSRGEPITTTRPCVGPFKTATSQPSLPGLEEPSKEDHSGTSELAGLTRGRRPFAITSSRTIVAEHRKAPPAAISSERPESSDWMVYQVERLHSIVDAAIVFNDKVAISQSFLLFEILQASARKTRRCNPKSAENQHMRSRKYAAI